MTAEKRLIVNADDPRHTPGTTADKLLIVNADDLGRTPGINAGIFEAHERGLVTSATLIVAYPTAEAAARRLADHPALGVGLHVQLTGGRPLLPPASVSSLVDEAGRLPRWPDGLHGAEPTEILAEVRAQLDRFRLLTGREPTHLDSHHHSHRVPAVTGALVSIAREVGLPVRNAGPEVEERLKRAGVPANDAFVESFFGDGATLENLLAILGRLEPGVTELMCHPAHVDDELRQGSTYVDAREAELAALTSPEARERLQAEGIRLVSFEALAEPAS